MEIAYTIGHTEKYDELLRTLAPGQLKKMGRRTDYDGGWIWKTIDEALKFLTQVDFEAAVYEVELSSDWNKDVSKEVSSDGVHRLIYDAVIIRKIDEQQNRKRLV